MCTADSIQVRAGCCECVENAAASVSEPEKRFVVHSCLVFTKIIMFKYESTLTVVPSCFCRVSLDLCRSGVFGDHRYANESISLKILTSLSDKVGVHLKWHHACKQEHKASHSALC